MGISWSKGLLAAASGVAKYSEQEQERKQRRMDKTAELENGMRMQKAKSAYAVKMNEYAASQAKQRKYAGLEAGSIHEQVSLYKDLGYNEKAAIMAAQHGMQTGKLIKRPVAMKEPEFSAKGVIQEAGRAKSPIQRWIEQYRGKGNGQDELGMPKQDLEVRSGSPVASAPSPQDFGTDQAVSSQFTRPTDPIAAVAPTETNVTDIDTGGPGGIPRGAGHFGSGQVIDGDPFKGLYDKPAKDPKVKTRTRYEPVPGQPGMEQEVNVSYNEQTGEVIHEANGRIVESNTAKVARAKETTRLARADKSALRKSSGKVKDSEVTDLFEERGEERDGPQQSGSKDTHFNELAPGLATQLIGDDLDTSGFFDSDLRSKKEAMSEARKVGKSIIRLGNIKTARLTQAEQEDPAFMQALERSVVTEAVVGELGTQDVITSLMNSKNGNESEGFVLSLAELVETGNTTAIESIQEYLDENMASNPEFEELLDDLDIMIQDAEV